MEARGGGWGGQREVYWLDLAIGMCPVSAHPQGATECLSRWCISALRTRMGHTLWKVLNIGWQTGKHIRLPKKEASMPTSQPTVDLQ